MSKLEENARIKLAALMAELQPIIDSHISQLSTKEVDFILANYRKYLKVDLERDLEKARLDALTHSPFDSILSDTDAFK